MTSGLRRCSVPAREILWRYNGASNVYIVKVRTVNPGHVLRRSARQTDARARARKRIFFHAALAGARLPAICYYGENVIRDSPMERGAVASSTD